LYRVCKWIVGRNPAKGITTAAKGIAAASKGITTAAKGITAAAKGITTAAKGITTATEWIALTVHLNAKKRTYCYKSDQTSNKYHAIPPAALLVQGNHSTLLNRYPTH
jgi:hypothetical protein